MNGRMMLISGNLPDDRTLVENAAATDRFLTALSVRSQMESLRIGGQIPGSVLGAPPPYQKAGAFTENAEYVVTTTDNPFGESGSSTTSNMINTEAEYENRFHKSIASDDYEFGPMPPLCYSSLPNGSPRRANTVLCSGGLAAGELVDMTSSSAIKLELIGQITNLKATFHFGTSISPRT
uniref:CRE-CST-1 protein n=1 Tax=Haemonchus contortus TaxID=6289 RepID=W6NDK6_HAECO